MQENRSVPEEELARSKESAHRLFLKNEGKGRSYFIETYGCQMNEHDSEKLAGLLTECGYVEAADRTNADIILFNTCCVREHAEKRLLGNLGMLKKLKDGKSELVIGVCGCMMQQREVADKLMKRFPFVDIVFGTNELHMFPYLLERVSSGERIELVRDMAGEIAEGLPVKRASDVSQFVTIMYGCNNFCSYCIVPYVRGRERSRRSEDIVREVTELVKSGAREVTLLGQNVNSYHGEGDVSFPKLLSLVNAVPGIERIRFMTSHPKDLSEELIEAMATLDKVCHHIHLPVQSGSDRILALMNRKYDRERYISVVEALRKRVPDIELTTDIIVGFPGETEEDFQDTLSLVERVEYSAAYTFKYSIRKGTKAAEMSGQLEESVKKERLERLNTAIAAGLRRGNEKYIGATGKVLVEGCDHRDKPMAFGKLDNFKMVYFPGDESLIGSTVNVKIGDIAANSLIGEKYAD